MKVKSPTLQEIKDDYSDEIKDEFEVPGVREVIWGFKLTRTGKSFWLA